MFKRTKGYFLLMMLVLTGLAGKLQSDTLSGKERRYLINELKISKTALGESITGLSEKQLNFRPAKNKPSIRDCIFHLVSAEDYLWKTTKASLETEPQAQKIRFHDESLNALAITATNNLQYPQMKFDNLKAALKLYKNGRAEMQRYVNTSTENVRAHFAATTIGFLDAYQLMLLNTIYTKYYTQEIEKIKASPNFPK
jgi:hypothetical protein